MWKEEIFKYNFRCLFDCDRKFLTANDMMRHMLYCKLKDKNEWDNLSTVMLTCPECSKQVSAKLKYAEHYRRKHSEVC